MLAKNLQGAAAAAVPAYIEDVFSTYLYTGTGSSQTITNGIDLAGEGGLVWVKNRNLTGYSPLLYDTARGAGNYLASNSANPQGSFGLSAFNADGFTGSGGYDFNDNGQTFASWTFRKQAKFFDVVTYTGNGSNRTISHNLGSVPGCIIVKRTDNDGAWQVYHRSLANTEYLVLNTTAAKATGATRWNSTTPTSTEFSLGTDSTVNANGGTYVAYLFAHDAGGFGASGSDNAISCGSYTTDGSAVATVNLGYEPQWVLAKGSSNASGWYLIDNMRGFAYSNTALGLQAQSSQAESASSSGANGFYPTATGFVDNGIFGTNSTIIYIAIRRGPMKTPTSGTSVFTPVARTGTGADQQTSAGFPIDLGVVSNRASSSTSKAIFVDRLRGQPFLVSSSTAAGVTSSGVFPSNPFDSQTSLKTGTGSDGVNTSGQTYVDHLFRRAPGFFDVVCDTGTGSAHTISHTLGSVPELMIRKKRSAADRWVVYANNDNTDYLVLNTTAATVDDNTMWDDTSPTSSVFTVGTNDDVNGSGATFVTYLFATVSGVSKVGSYTGTGTTKQIDCGFTGGARFVLIKRIDSTGDWYVWDTARGIVSGNDPYLLLNSTAAEVTNTDYIDTYSAGFEISSTAPAAINANGGTFIFFAVA
jgi:hypothetical protein